MSNEIQITQVLNTVTVNTDTNTVTVTPQVNDFTIVSTGAIVPTKAEIGLSEVDNTSDLNKPVSTATQTALNLKADKLNPAFSGTVSLADNMLFTGNFSDRTLAPKFQSNTGTFTSITTKPPAGPANNGSQFSARSKSDDNNYQFISIQARDQDAAPLRIITGKIDNGSVSDSDKKIHFIHALSGVTYATISPVAAVSATDLTTKSYVDGKISSDIATLNYPVASVNGKTDVVVLTTTDITEGSRLYYTDARFDTRLASKTTNNLTEGTNLYYTNTRARQSISVSDQGGDGSLTYDSGSGNIIYNGPSATEVRAHFTAGTGVSITAGTVAIGQPVGTTSNVTFNDGNFAGTMSAETVSSKAYFDEDLAGDQIAASIARTVTTQSTSTVTVTSTNRRAMKIVIVADNGVNTQVLEAMVLRDAADPTGAQVTFYAELATGASLGTFTADFSAGLIRLLVTPSSSTATTFKVVRTALF